MTSRKRVQYGDTKEVHSFLCPISL